MTKQTKYTYNEDGDITHKRCIQCTEYKVLTDFNIKKENKTDGRNPVCKKCRSENQKNLNYPSQKTGTKECSNCKQILDVSKFSRKKVSSDGLQSICKTCQNKRMQLHSSTLDNFIKKIFLNLKHNTKKRSKDLDIQITIQDIKDLYNKQNGKCALSNIKMTHIAYNTVGNQHTINKWNISIDRIDSTKGYTPDNIQLICTIINRMKSDMDDTELVLLANKVSIYNVDKIKQINKSKKYKDYPIN